MPSGTGSRSRRVPLPRYSVWVRNGAANAGSSVSGSTRIRWTLGYAGSPASGMTSC